MKRIAMVSVTNNAIVPMLKRFGMAPQKYSLCNYLDEGLQKRVQEQNGITRETLVRMLELLDKAAQDGADGILLTCTVFTPYIDLLRQIIDVPMFSADGAMLEQAVMYDKSTAILCTFPASVESSTSVFQSAQKKHGKKADMDTFLVEAAAAALRENDKAKHDRLIAERALELASQYDQIVLSQISMSDASELLRDCKKPVLTSPQSTVEAIEHYYADH